MPARSTGFPGSDAQDDFSRARRRQARRRLGRRFERGGADVDLILPFDEVVAELGRTGEHDLGLERIELDSVVGTVDRDKGGFDRRFAPTTSRVRTRWERIAEAMRRGEPLPAISVYRVGEVHFVRDGHHRVSVARALGETHLDARVVEVSTRIGAERELTLADLPLKGHERLFRERVPLPEADARRVVLSDPWRYGELAEGVEAWAFRVMQDRVELLGRADAARVWFAEEFTPVVAMLREAGLDAPGQSDADAYLAVSCARYRLSRTQEWTPEIIERLRRER
ncbi:MAG: chromosome partitioning protein ParB [Solirubrobacterales bacterium]|nr:chromosome partitioning protein ParB [Solirubrobacterales bacterium]